MDACDKKVTVSIRYRPGNLRARPPVKVVIDGRESFYLSTEEVRRIMLTPGRHELKLKCRLKRKKVSFEIDNHTRITIGFYNECCRIRTRISTVDSEDELDYARAGY